MNREQKFWIEQQLRRFPFVEWDRFIEWRLDDDIIIRVFGWIDRQDTFKDFVAIELLLKTKQVEMLMTSSAEYSKKICEIIYGLGEEYHQQCKRVEHRFQISNSIKLKEDYNAITKTSQEI